MKLVTVTFTVDDEVAENMDNDELWALAKSEMNEASGNSECGLIYNSCTIEE